MFDFPVYSRGSTFSDSSGYSSGRESQDLHSSQKLSQIISPKPDRGSVNHTELEPPNEEDLENSIERDNNAMCHAAKDVDGKYKTYSNCGVAWKWINILGCKF